MPRATVVAGSISVSARDIAVFPANRPNVFAAGGLRGPFSFGFFRARAETGMHPWLLAMRRKAFQDSPTPAGNAVAAIALLRLFAYTDEAAYREKTRRTVESFAASAARYGIFVATFGQAGVRLLQPHAQVVVVGEGAAADELYRAATRSYSFTRAVLKLSAKDMDAAELPPSLSVTIPQMPAVREGQAMALLCSGLTCEAPISNPEELARRVAHQ